ncbi:MAG: hypothetical protein G01um10148_1004 [Parcubacteria group bacterium Gr01-1014_8]|nr:MAG: hypothetical protein G01um10148_1004 [Parcubacteria group bacterium Gr01-1014_8]
MTILKSIGAVLAGLITVVVLSMGTDWVLEQVGIFPPVSDQGLFVTWMLVVAFLYRSLYAIVGGYVTAMLAPDEQMRHVKILAVLGVIGGIAGVVAGWNLSQHWYPTLLAVTAFPLVWLGGKLRMRNTQPAIPVV